MLVTSQLPIQTTKIFDSIFDVHLCPPHFEKRSATYAPGYYSTHISCMLAFRDIFAKYLWHYSISL